MQTVQSSVQSSHSIRIIIAYAFTNLRKLKRHPAISMFFSILDHSRYAATLISIPN